MVGPTPRRMGSIPLIVGSTQTLVPNVDCDDERTSACRNSQVSPTWP